MNTLLDTYAWEARVKPALIVLLPVAFACIAWEPRSQDFAEPLIGAAVGAGILLLLANIARSAGQRLQGRLVKDWGGLPSTLMLRHRDGQIDPLTKARYHQALKELVPNATIPSATDEAAGPDAADQVYEACRSALLAKTRDQKAFRLVFQENMNYGFRRNLVGLRGLGMLLAGGGVAGCVWKIIRDVGAGHAVTLLSVLGLLGCVALLWAWVTVLNTSWVRRSANDYARRLLEAIDLLAMKPAASNAEEHRGTPRRESAS